MGADRIDGIGDLAGYNGDGANIADFQSPGHPSVVTEYGSTLADRPGEYIPGWGDLARDEGWKGRPWRGGQVIWCGFDHGSIFGGNMAKLGIVDYFRLPKRSWYWYRNEYAHQAPPQWPVEGRPAKLRLTASKTEAIRTDGTDDVQLIVTVLDAEGRELSNSPDVRLSVVSGPGEFPTGRSIAFSADSDIRIQDGKAAIALRAYYAGRTVVEASSEAASVLAASVEAASVEAASVPAASVEAASVPAAGAELSVVVFAEPHPASAAITRVAAAAIATNFFFIIFLLYTNRFPVCDCYHNGFPRKKKAGYGLVFVRFM